MDIDDEQLTPLLQKPYSACVHAGRWPFGGTGYVSLSPVNQLAEHGLEITAACRRMVLLARGVFPVTASLDQSALLKTIEAVGEDVGRDALR
jgi:hypothetical protein